MKFLFSVYGYGLGHATRCHAIMKALKDQTKVIASENAYDYFNKQGYQPQRINSFKIGNVMKSFSWFNTIFENIDFPFTMMADYNIMKRTVNQFKPDVIISDTEPVSIIFAHTAGLTNAFISNIMQIPYEYERLPKSLQNPKLDGQEAMIRLLIDQVMRKSDLILSPTINSYSMGMKVKFTDLIVRKHPKQLKSVEKIKQEYRLPDDFILVSFGGASITHDYYKTLLPILQSFKDQNFVISTNNAVRREQKIGNVKLYPFIDDYLSILKTCKGVICLAGHSTISEALVYNKPCFVIPIKDHVEQLINAVIIKNLGLGQAHFKGDLKNSLKEFFNRIDEYKRSINKAGFKGKGNLECAKYIQTLKK